MLDTIVYLIRHAETVDENGIRNTNQKGGGQNTQFYLTGKENYPEVLNKIVTKQVELSDNVC